jgi:hypothetical protein
MFVTPNELTIMYRFVESLDWKMSFGKFYTREEWLSKLKFFRNLMLHEDRII